MGDTDVEGVVSEVLTHSSDAISQIIAGSRARPQISAHHTTAPPGARLGWGASLGDVCGNRYFVGFCLVRINGKDRPLILLAGSHSFLVLGQGENNA